MELDGGEVTREFLCTGGDMGSYSGQVFFLAEDSKPQILVRWFDYQLIGS